VSIKLGAHQARGEDEVAITTQVAILESDDVIINAVQNLNLITDPYLGQAKLTISETDKPTREERIAFTAKNLRKSLHVTRRPKTRLVNISIKHENADKAAAIANTIARHFISNSIDYEYDKKHYKIEALEENREKTLAEIDSLRAMDSTANAPKDRNAKLTAPSEQLLSKQRLLKSIVEQIEQESLLRLDLSNYVEVANPARGEHYAIISDTKARLVGGIILSVIIAISSCILLEFRNDKITTPEDVHRKLSNIKIPKNRLGERMTGLLKGKNDKELSDTPAITEPHLNIVGIIPKVGSYKQVHTDLVDPQSLLAESMSSLSASIIYGFQPNNNKVIHVTSTRAGEGKSTIALGLALRFSGINKSVLIIDACIRRPTFVASDLDIGLSGLLNSQKTLKAAVVQTLYSNINLLPSGRFSHNAAELLMTERFGHIINQVREDYDYIIIDGPPVLDLADAIAIGSSADTTLYVVGANYTRAKSIMMRLERLLQADINVLGLVLNRIRDNTSTVNQHMYFSTNEARAPQALSKKQRRKIKGKMKIDISN